MITFKDFVNETKKKFGWEDGFDTYAESDRYWRDVAHETGSDPIAKFGEGDAAKYRKHVQKYVKKPGTSRFAGPDNAKSISTPFLEAVQIRDGMKVRLAPDYAESDEVFTVSQCDPDRKRCWISDKHGRGWYASFYQLADKKTGKALFNEGQISEAAYKVGDVISFYQSKFHPDVEAKVTAIRPDKKVDVMSVSSNIEYTLHPDAIIVKSKPYAQMTDLQKKVGNEKLKAAAVMRKKLQKEDVEINEAAELTEIFADQGSGSSDKENKEWEKKHNAAKSKQGADAYHRVAVTVSDPNHQMVTKRNEKVQKFIRMKDRDVKTAVEQAKQYYKKKGYRVHGAEFVESVGSE